MPESWPATATWNPSSTAAEPASGGKAGVSNFANKQVLHMAALNSVRYNQEIKTYFNRMVAEGKSKMSVLNAVRNKLLHQIVAVVKRGTPYVIKLNKI